MNAGDIVRRLVAQLDRETGPSARKARRELDRVIARLDREAAMNRAKWARRRERAGEAPVEHRRETTIESAERPAAWQATARTPRRLELRRRGES